MKTNIMGVMFDNYTISEAVALATKNHVEPFVIVTPNPEIVQAAKSDKPFCDVLNAADIVTPDGIGIVYASKILGGHIKERAAGFDICVGILQALAKMGDKKVFLFGGKPHVAEQAAENLKQKYPGIQIAGTADGYFDEKKEQEIIRAIREASPDLLLVCLGAKKQEMWIAENKNQLNAKILIGAGGTVDVLAGKTKRAPDIFIKCGMEWFYRLMKEPKRIGRMMQLPLFLAEIVFKRGEYKK